MTHRAYVESPFPQDFERFFVGDLEGDYLRELSPNGVMDLVRLLADDVRLKNDP